MTQPGEAKRRKGVRTVLTVDAMHDEQWTQRAAMGEMELGKLAKVLAKYPAHTVHCQSRRVGVVFALDV